MAMRAFEGPLERLDECRWRIPRTYKRGMRVDGQIFADDRLIDSIRSDPAPEQVANVAFLPGIQVASLAMPDIHWGYGFPIGGVCATDPEEGGVISPGGVGYDINCGVRLVRTNLEEADVRPRLDELVRALFAQIPTGVGRGGKYRFDRSELCELMRRGPAALLERGLAVPLDLEHTEAGGCLAEAVPELVSDRALDRGYDQCGTLGAGNHFLEVDVVESVSAADAAEVLGLRPGGICVLIHSGSRGLGYQVCDDALRALRDAPSRYGIALPDRQLVCAPVHSPEGQEYLGAMRAAANFAWCNRQLLMWQTREVFAEVFGRTWNELGMELVYDVAHNIAKLEEHEVERTRKRVWVHRKGATRAFPPGHPETPRAYAAVGQPVIIPGDMGRASWVLVGAPGSMQKSFGSACHGAGRMLSRHAAARRAHGRKVEHELRHDAYKDVDRVVDVVHKAGIARKVARLRPIGVIKG
jgi:tRNA-splicing ligase RtcB